MNSTHPLDYGLIGVELNRAIERQNEYCPQAHRHEPIVKTGETRIRMARQRLGDTMIQLGTRIAGETRPVTAHPGTRPAIDPV